MVLALVLVLVLGLVLTVDTMDISVATLATPTSWWLSVMLVRHFCNWQLSAGHCLRLYSVSAVPTALLVTIYCSCSLQCDAVWQSTDWMCITLTTQTALTRILRCVLNTCHNLSYFSGLQRWSCGLIWQSMGSYTCLGQNCSCVKNLTGVTMQLLWHWSRQWHIFCDSLFVQNGC